MHGGRSMSIGATGRPAVVSAGSGSPPEGAARVLTPAAVDFVAGLRRRCAPARPARRRARPERQAGLNAGERVDCRAETAGVRRDAWRVAPAPADLEDRRVEITGPVERKMMSNALNSGARVFMADLE